MSGSEDLQRLCELGQEHLIATRYLQAERALVHAEQLALQANDFDTLARLYMPLQEARRQRRLICGEGIIQLDLIARGPDDALDVEQIAAQSSKGQFLLAGWGSIEPALRLRQLQSERDLYIETFLAAAYPVGAGRAIVIVPTADVRLPGAAPISLDGLLRLIPPHSIVFNEAELPRGPRPGNAQTFAQTMALWERLHAPFLAAADMQVDPMRKIDGYRRTIAVDYACELAHQKLSDVARQIARLRRADQTSTT